MNLTLFYFYFILCSMHYLLLKAQENPEGGADVDNTDTDTSVDPGDSGGIEDPGEAGESSDIGETGATGETGETAETTETAETRDAGVDEDTGASGDTEAPVSSEAPDDAGTSRTWAVKPEKPPAKPPVEPPVVPPVEPVEPPPVCVCPELEGCGKSLKEIYCNQPYFYNFVPKTEDNKRIDNVCVTYFQLPEDCTYKMFLSIVYCNGTTIVYDYIAKQLDEGVVSYSSPYCTFVDTTFAKTGCKTSITYRCFKYGECTTNCMDQVPVFGQSPICRPIGVSSLIKAEDAIRNQGLPDQDYYVLPMKLPTKCITSQFCFNNIRAQEFQKAVGVYVKPQCYNKS